MKSKNYDNPNKTCRMPSLDMPSTVREISHYSTSRQRIIRSAERGGIIYLFIVSAYIHNFSLYVLQVNMKYFHIFSNIEECN